IPGDGTVLNPGSGIRGAVGEPGQGAGGVRMIGPTGVKPSRGLRAGGFLGRAFGLLRCLRIVRLVWGGGRWGGRRAGAGTPAAAGGEGRRCHSQQNGPDDSAASKKEVHGKYL